MMYGSKTRSSLGTALLFGLATFGAARSASASLSFPAALQKALSKQFPGVTFCIPSCAACHLTTLGGPGNINVFGASLERPIAPNTYPNLIVGNSGDVDKKVNDAIVNYFASTPPAGFPTAIANFPAPDVSRQSYDSDQDGISDYEELRVLDSPSLKLPRGEKEFCPDITYGCGARVAAAPPPVDRLGLLSGGLVVLGLLAFRRLKRGPRSA